LRAVTLTSTAAKLPSPVRSPRSATPPGGSRRRARPAGVPSVLDGANPESHARLRQPPTIGSRAVPPVPRGWCRHPAVVS